VGGAPDPGRPPEEVPDYTCESLADAAYWLLSHERELRA
jgi:hypothetical protein